MGKKLETIIIARDTREKDNEGWVFPEEEKKSGKIQIMGTTELCIPAGDYSLIIDEILRNDICVIERKASCQELYGNLMTKDAKDRFYREMEKLRSVKYKYILIESTLNKDLWGMTLPQYKGYGPTVSKLYEELLKINMEFGVNFQFVGDCGKKVARRIFEQAARTV